MSTQKTRRQMLEEFVAANPTDAFARYGLAMELSRSGEAQAAAAQFETLIRNNPDYVPGYQMYGQMLAESGDAAKAREILQRGIATAQKAGNAHAADEMRGVLDTLA
jgi:Protein of avirulence locus involved in temperature-dependent protein secretion